MSLQHLLDIALAQQDIRQEKNDINDSVITEQRLQAQMSNIRDMIAFYREYPDYFVDDIKGENCDFKFYFYQRIYLREVMRYRNVYAVYPRAYSKSFLAVMALMLRCILYPGSHLFVSTGGN